MTAKITKLDKAALTALREPLNAVLAELGQKLGLEIRLGNGSFGDGAEASFKLILRVDDPATKLAAAKAEYERQCRFVGVDWDRPEETGLRPEDFGTEFQSGGVTYRLAGLFTKGRGSQKFPIKVEVVNDPSGRCKPGEVRMFAEKAASIIRAATDKANPTPKAKGKAKVSA